MCPRQIDPPQPRTTVVPTVHSIVYTEWADTATCVKATYFRDRTSGSKLCCECYTDEASSDETRDRVADYEVVIRHGMKIGFGPYYEECGNCYVVLGNEQTIADCETCESIYFNFLDHILETGDTPFNDPEPTIITISQIRRSIPNTQESN